MIPRFNTKTCGFLAGVAVTLLAGGMLITSSAQAQNKEPIKIGFGQSLTGFLSPNGKQALLGAEIWRDRVNKEGGLLGRKVELVYYDDKSSPQEVPGIYTKLLDVDKVDLVVGGYATNQNAPAMPVIIRKGKTYISLFALDVNSQFKYPKYFRSRERRSRSRRPSRWHLPTPSSRSTPARARAKTPRRAATRSSTTRAIRLRRRPVTSRQSCRRSRRRMPTW
jgi:hypothetical protein